MARLAVDIDPIAIIRNVFGGDIPDPAHMVVLAELGGAESIVCYLRDDLKSVNDRDISVVSELVKTHLNVRTGLSDETVRKILKLKPHMITFVSPGSGANLEAYPIDIQTYGDTLGNFTADLRANEIMTSVLIEPDINLIKLAGKADFDYVELFTQSYSSVDDLDQQLAELENINTLVDAANRLGLGVNASGSLNQDNISDLAKIPMLDDLIVGNPLIVKSMAIGFEQAVRDFISML